jgi:hypothetical protein
MRLVTFGTKKLSAGKNGCILVSKPSDIVAGESVAHREIE